MCGICGVWNYATGEPVNRNLLREMTRTMVHRGPDDEGFFFDDANGVGLGFRRLAIIDRSPAGHQPMSNEDQTVWVVFNGEIYNFQELRPALEACGHRFRSQTDTEVILHQYEEHGTSCVEDLHGMFGLAIWDGGTRQLVLARDRVGKKPLFYYDDGQRLLFGSELKAILADRTVPRHLEPSAIAEYLSLGYVGSPRTILQHIAKLSPGHLLVHGGKPGNRYTPRRYWDWLPSFQTSTPAARSEEEWGELLRETLRDVVRCRMVSDVPLGAFLSGGVDSSAVVATMASLSEQPVRTFSIGFEDQTHNELPYARQVAQRWGTAHQEYLVRPEHIDEVLPRLARQFDEPFGDSSALPTYYVSNIARQEVTVCLSGDGGDEALAGYDRYMFAMQDRWIDTIPRWLRVAALVLPSRLTGPTVKGNRRSTRLMLDEDGRYAFSMQTFYAAQARAVLTPEMHRYVQEISPFLAQTQHQGAHLDLLSRLQYLDARTYLPEDILVKVDRTSMLNSLETRCPLLDHRFLDVAAKIPPALRFSNGRDGTGWEGKYMLKRALRPLVPDEVLYRPKMGFAIPGQRWIAEDPAGFVREVLSPERLTRRGIFQPEAVERLITRNASPARSFNTWSQVWSLMMFELWCQAYIGA
jgi:asparagine synthase (glutamine-hydrolysing)